MAVNSAPATVTITASLQAFAVTVSKSGGGGGAVSSTPSGLTCTGLACTGAFDYGTSVTLTAAPDVGSLFGGWTGCDSSIGPSCIVSTTSAKSVTASFTLQAFTLSLTKTGNGAGGVASSPTGIDCGATCGTTFNYGSTVTLTATANPGSSFTGWTGDCTGTGSCTLTMDQTRTVTAAFAVLTLPLMVSLDGSGSGTVTSSPAGIACPADCSDAYPAGAPITLTATPAANSVFAGWGGACAGTGPCTVTVDTASSVTAMFTPIPVSLSVSVSNSWVNVAPGGGDIHALALDPTTPTTLYAGTAYDGVFKSTDGGESWSPASTGLTSTYVQALALDPTTPGTLYAGTAYEGVFKSTDGGGSWSAASTGLTNPYVFALALDPATPVTLYAGTAEGGVFRTTVAGAGGTVTSNDGGISCPGQCAQTYPNGTSVTLQATPAPGYTFTGWSGAGCNGIGDCTVSLTLAPGVTMTQNRSLTASFAPATFMRLTVVAAGTGSGTVSPVAAGTSAMYTNGAVVILTATADLGSTLTGWSVDGGACPELGIGGLSCTIEMTQALNVTVTFSGPPTVTDLTADHPAPQPAGTPITLTATATGGTGSYRSRWYLWDGARSVLLRAWASGLSYTWTPAFGNDVYSITVHVRDASGTWVASSQRSIPYPITGPPSVTSLTADKPAPQPAGTPIVLTAAATGGSGAYESQWYVGDGGSSVLLRDWAAGLSTTWTPAAGNAAYRITVHVRDAGGTWDAASQRSLSFPIAGPLTDIRVSFRLDPWLLGGTYVGGLWVSSPTLGPVSQGGSAFILETRADGFDATGTASKIIPEWIPADPEMVTVSPSQGHLVTITVQRTGQSTLQVVSQGFVKTLSIKAEPYLGSAILVEISQ